jgi:A/G-specific adenine glycosylase
MTADTSIEINGHSIQLPRYRSRLKNWGRDHVREFSWRKTRDPYPVLMAEYMLLRTQAKQVVPVYNEFLKRYPSISSLAEASEDTVQKILAPLGLKWRAEYVYEAGQILSTEYGGEVPLDVEELMSLPGVSVYIARAVRCLVLDVPDPMIDTNTVRIAGRLFGLEVKPSSRRNQQFRSLIEALVDPEEPRLYNLSMLDFGAAVCTSRDPDCPSCPLLDMCVHGQRSTA